MLKLANTTPDQYWAGANIELNLSYGSLRDYQWKRLLEKIWGYSGITGPFEKRYFPNLPDPPLSEIRLPDPTSTISQYGAFELVPDVRVGFELLCTRSLFECISLLVPITMFENVTNNPQDDGLLYVESILVELALDAYYITRFDLAALGVNRECQLLAEMLADSHARQTFLEQGNFLVQDDILVTLHVDPAHYLEIKPALRWCPHLE